MTLRILEPGLYTLVVDYGRPSTRSLGVPVSGAADRFSMAVGNGLVGNLPDTPALEISLVGPTIQAGCQLACVVFGAPFTITSGRRRFRAGTTFTLEQDEVISIRTTAFGMRAYLCVRGGFEGARILNSRSSLEPLKAGADLQCSPGKIGTRFVRQAFAWDRQPCSLRAVDGPERDWFAGNGFFDLPYRVAEASDRMGIRLEGGKTPPPAQDMISEPVCPGSVQVTGECACIILGVDAQTIGGYPKIAQVISADLDKLGQLRPGEQVRFTRVSLAEAEILYRQKQQELREWTTRLRTTLSR